MPIRMKSGTKQAAKSAQSMAKMFVPAIGGINHLAGQAATKTGIHSAVQSTRAKAAERLATFAAQQQIIQKIKRAAKSGNSAKIPELKQSLKDIGGSY